MRQSSANMLFRRNTSVCTQSLEALYFYGVQSHPALTTGAQGRSRWTQALRRGGGEDVTPDADGSSVRRGWT